MSVRPVVLAWSGGKDSSLALAALRADPAVDVVAVLTTITRDYDRISIHGVRRAVLEAQVAALGLPLIEVTIPAAATNARMSRRSRPCWRPSDMSGRTCGTWPLATSSWPTCGPIVSACYPRSAGRPSFRSGDMNTPALAQEFVRAAIEQFLRVLTRLNSGPSLRAASSTRRFWPSCRLLSTHAGSAASFTRVCMLARSSVIRSQCKPGCASGVTAASSTVMSRWCQMPNPTLERDTQKARPPLSLAVWASFAD